MALRHVRPVVTSGLADKIQQRILVRFLRSEQQIERTADQLPFGFAS